MTVVRRTPVAQTASSGLPLASRGTSQAGGILAFSGDRFLVPPLDDSLLFKDTPQMKRALFRSWNSLQVCMRHTLPGLLELYKQQVEQVRQTQMAHVRRLLVDGCIDEYNLRKVGQLIDNMCDALVEMSGPKKRIEQEIQLLEKEFTEAGSPGGIGQSLEEEIRRITRHRRFAYVWHSCKSMYTDLIRPCFAGFAPPDFADAVSAGAVADGISAGAVTELALHVPPLNAVSPPITCCFIGVGTYLLLKQISSRSVSVEQVMREYDGKLEEAKKYSGMCDRVEMFLQAAKNETSKFTLCKDRLLQIKGTISLLSPNRVDARKWSCDRLCDFFNKVDLAHIIEPFTKSSVNGKAFVEHVTEQMLRDDFGVKDELTLRRVLGYQQDLASGADVEAIEALRQVADAIDETIRGILSQIQTMLQYAPVVV